MKRILRVVTLLIVFLTVTKWNGVSAAITSVTVVTSNVCYGANHGSISTLPAGGTSPYTYNWSNGTTAQNATNLIAGSYTVTITDNTGVTAGFTYTVTQPTALVVTRAVTNENCGGQSIGTITLNITNPSSVYTFRWSNGATTESIVNLTAAQYYVTITDAIGCTTIDSADVVQPPGVGITDTITGVTCSAGMNNGAINIGVQYGNPPYSYVWNDGPTTQNRNTLTTGTYILTVTDAIGCTATSSATVNQLPGGMSVNTSGTNPTCHGGTNGSATVTSTVGSTAPYTYLWSNSSTLQTVTGLGTGTYSVTATSGTGCIATATVTLTQPASITATIHTFPPTCNGENNGAITSTAASGTSPYSYAWTGGYTTSSINTLTAGNYILTVTDHKGCTFIDTATLTQPSAIVVTCTASQLTCAGANSGAITTSVSGGLAPYTYWWGSVATANRTNIPSGTYTVTVTDANGCTGAGSATINAYTPMSLTTASTAAVCYGANNGAINLTVNNGTSPYGYIWNNGNTTNNPDTLLAGTYTVTVTDNKSCTTTTSATVSGPAFPIVVNDTIHDVSCFGLSDASISLYPVYGTPPYIYKWSGVGISSSRTNLAAGNYTVSISDNAGCTVTSTYTVTQPTLITPVTAVTNVSCFGGGNGAINLSVTGGYSPFGYSWNDGVHSQTRSSLHSGSYAVTITDNHGCTMTAGATVTQPTQLTASATGTNPGCNGGNNGTVTLTTAGGTIPYTYNWGAGITTQNRNGLAAGIYNVIVTDSAGCTATATQTLTAPPAISITATGSAIACSGGNTGTVTTNTTGGTLPYTYNWQNGSTTQNISSLAAGIYPVTVTDHDLCSAITSGTVTQSLSLTANAVATNVSCYGGSNGTIIPSVSGGTGPYTYDWGGGIHSTQRNNLAAGTYQVTITDHAGCSSNISSTITQPTLLSVSATSTPATCFGGNGGTIHITAAGGTGAYTYNWGGGITTQNRSNLPAGSYTLLVTDSAACTVSSTTTITQPTQLTVTTTQTNVTCYGGNDGSIQTTPAGGTAGYTFNWGNSITTANRTGLAQGSYIVTVTDANGCSITNTTAITQPNALTANAVTTNVSCYGQADGTIALTVSGGNGGYTYNWGSITTQNRYGLAAGNYTVIVTDAHGCSVSTSASITQPIQIAANVTATTNASCFGSNNGSINTSIIGGVSPFTYLWSNGATTQNISNAGAGSYIISVTDAHGCTASSAATTITQPAQVTVATNATNNLCNGDATGTITTTVNGGNGSYSYLWSNNATTANINNLTTGSYTVVCHDALSCSASASAQVTQPTAISLIPTHTDVTCNGGNTGTATIQATGGTGAYTYNWTGGQTTAQITQLAQGTYSVTVHDANLCAGTAIVTVSQINSIVLNTTPTNALCAGQANGSIQTTVSGGAGSYTYTWTNGATTASITNLTAASYTVTVTDANHCNSIATTTVTQPAAISITQTVTNANCFGSATGNIQLSSAGGTGASHYLWSNGATTQNISNIAAGSYRVTVTDANGCSITGGRSVSQPTQLNVNLNENDATCFGGSNGSVNSTVTGGNTPYIYLWSNSSSTANISNAQAGSYTVTIKDAMNCSATSSISVAQPTAITIQPTVTDVTCNGSNNGTASVTATGGAGNYSYAWSNQSTVQQISQLNAGAYTVTVRDANACSAQAIANVTQPQPVVLTTSVIAVGCSGKNDGSASVNVAGGTPPYLYNWSTLQKTATVDSLATGSYIVTVTDNNGCTGTQILTVTSAAPISATPTIVNTTCPGVNNGSISIGVTGGTTPYSYAWNTGSFASSVNTLAGGNYTVIITDAKGCTAQSGGSVTNGYELTIQASSSIDTTNNTPVQLTAITNMDHGNVYNWTPAAIVTCTNCENTSSKPTETTTYTVYVVDSNGCKAESAVTVIVNAPPVSTTTATSNTNIFIPNAFTPNGDGVNDQFKIFGSDLGDVYFMDIAVFDRWGEKVFESNDPNFAWDGVYKGQPAPQGVYVYVATAVFNSGEHKDFKGSVTIIR